MSDNVCEAFAKVCGLCIARDEAPVNQYPGCWEVQVDPWWIAFNGHDEARACSKGPRVDPYHCYVEYNGLPAGIFNPRGGVIASAEGADESAFIEALERATADALGGLTN